MDKKRSFFIFGFLAAFVIAAASGVGIMMSASMTAGWSSISIENEYEYKSNFEIENRTYTVGSETYNASSVLYYPDGTVSADKNNVLNEVGKYTVKYSVRAGENVYADSKSFIVNYPHYEVGSNKSSVRYCVPDGASTAGVVAKLTQNDSLVFTKYIDFTKVTPDDNLIRGFVIPDVAGSNDFTELVFTFTDSKDSSVYFKVHYYAYDWAYYTYAAANGQNQTPMGINQTQGLHEDDGYGLWSYVSFKSAGSSGVVAPDATQLFISMNYAEKKVYTLGYPGNKTEIIDLDDTSIVKNAWTGFPSGKARLSVDAYNYTGATATICITELFGLDDLSNNVFIDEDKPVLHIDDEYAGNMPDALKGYSYPIPGATAYDAYAYDCDVKVSVWYNYGMDNSVSVKVKDGKFVTDKVGTYGILYEAYDKIGNCSSEVRWVIAYEQISDVSFSVPDNTSAKLGEWVVVPEIDENTIEGGSGKKSIKTCVEIGGKREEISGGFRATETGVSKVIYVVTDHVGKAWEKSYDVNITANDKPVLEQNYDVYPVYISGGTYPLPEYYAFVTKNGKLVKELCKVEIEDGNGKKTYTAGENANIVVSNSGDPVKFTVISDGNTLASHEAIGVAAWVQEEAGKRFHLENYVVGDGFTAEKTSEGMVLTATDSEKMRFVFANALSSRHLSMRIGGINGATSNSQLSITLSDALDNTHNISFTIASENGKAYVVVGGVRYDISETTFGQGEVFETIYENNKLSINGTSIPLLSFNGFDRERIFVKVEYKGYGANAGLTFVGIGNCSFNTAQTDRFAPVIMSTYEVGGVQARGSEHTLYAPVAYDVYSPNLEYYLTVTAPDGSVLKDVNGVELNKVDPTINYIIRLDDIGTYKVEYYIAEAKSFISRTNVASLKYTLITEDEDAPEIEWLGEFPAELIVGDMFILPKYVVSDNISSSENIIVRVFIETPASQMLMLPGNSLQMTHEGVYEIRVMVVDEAGNITNYISQINVRRTV